MIRTQNASVNRKQIQKTKPTNEIIKADKVTPKSGPSGTSPKTDNGPHDKRRGWLINENRPGDPSVAPRCGAKTRRGGGACQAPAMPNGRCRMHGGLSTGPKTAKGKDRIRKALTKHGRYSAATKLRRERCHRIRMGPHFKGKWELLKSLREPRGGTEKSLTRQYRRSCVALAEAERGSPAAAVFEDAVESNHGPSMNPESTDVAESLVNEIPGTDRRGSWQWTPAKSTAASLVAEGERIRKIAQRVGVSEKTIDRWKQRPEFRARVDDAIQAHWAKTTPAQRAEPLRPASEGAVGKRTGRPRSALRCWCGENSWTRAEARCFACCRRVKARLEKLGVKLRWKFD